MAMTKKTFIHLAEAIKAEPGLFRAEHLEVLARFCAAENPHFLKHRWLGYIAGENGPNGGARKGHDEEDV